MTSSSHRTLVGPPPHPRQVLDQRQQLRSRNTPSHASTIHLSHISCHAPMMCYVQGSRTGRPLAASGPRHQSRPDPCEGFRPRLLCVKHLMSYTKGPGFGLCAPAHPHPPPPESAYPPLAPPPTT